MVHDHEFCNLHRHSEFSPLDGTGNANQYAEQAATVLNQKWLGLTDHATLGGALDHVRACRVADDDIDSELRPGEKRSRDEAIIPIVGCEVFWVGGDPYGSRLEKDFNANVKPHLCLHASGITGWKNLLAIVTQANLDGFHGVPRVDFDLLERHSEGIHCTTACISSPVCRSLKENDIEGATKFVRRLQSALDGRVWIEIMGHDVEDQRFVNPGLISIAREVGAGVVATTDAHAPFPEWTDTQSIVFSLSRRDTLKKIAEKEAAAQVSGDEVYGKELDSAYLMGAQDMIDLFARNHPDIPQSVVEEALKNTAEFAGGIRPYVVSKALKTPRASADESAAEKTLRRWCAEGFERELEQRGEAFRELVPDYERQLEFELSVLRDKEVMDYFVLVADAVRWIKSDLGLPAIDEDGNLVRDEDGNITYEGTKRPRPVGPGRGSAAGCLLSYLIGITGMDPMPYGLLFERFLNPDRKGLPDIDIDFRTQDRDLMVEYLSRVYGRDCVAHVITYQTFGPRATIGDLAKYFDAGPNKVDFRDVVRVKETFGNLDKDIAKLRQKNPTLDEFAKKYPELWKHGERIDDMVKAPSKHASAIVITPDPITTYAPLARSRGKAKDGSDDKLVFAWADRAAFPVVSEYGFFKVDVLGLEELDRHDYALDLIEQNTGERPDIYRLPIMWDPSAAEPEVMEGFKKGHTVGVFQFGGAGFTQLIRAIKPDTVLDLAAANALYRPGAMEYAFEFAKKKKGELEVTYWHDKVVPFLEETFGLVAYQEQVMQICKAMGDFTPGQADDMRKAMSKLYRLPGDEAQRFMEKFRSQWDAGCENNGIPDGVRDTVWQSILKWGQYGFNKSHSASYALLAYIDMWLKTHYPNEFYAALLTHRGSLEVRDIIREASQVGVRILSPDVNKSERGFTIERRLKGSALRYGLVAVKNIGGKAANDIMARRPYESFEDFLGKQKVSDGEEGESAFSIADALNLVRAGAFDAIDDRTRLLTQVKKIFGDQTVVYDVHMECGCVLKGRKWDPDDPYKRDASGAVETFKTGAKKGEPKLRGKMPSCGKHSCDTWSLVEPREELWTVAQHLHKNLSLKNPNPMPDGGTVPSAAEVDSMEEEVLGISLGRANKTGEYERIIAEDIEVDGCEHVIRQSHLESVKEKRRVTTGGELVSKRTAKIKNGPNAGKDMAFITVGIAGEEISCTVFNDTYEDYRDVLDKAAFVLIKGTKNNYQGESSIIAHEIYDFEQFIKEAA